MTPQALQHWQLIARALSDNALHALLRGLRSRDDRVAPSPLYYALICGDALPAHMTLVNAARIEHQAGLAQPSPILGQPGGLMEATHWACWWHGTEDSWRYDALALEVLAELERRSRVPLQVSVC